MPCEVYHGHCDPKREMGLIEAGRVEVEVCDGVGGSYVVKGGREIDYAGDTDDGIVSEIMSELVSVSGGAVSGGFMCGFMNEIMSEIVSDCAV